MKAWYSDEQHVVTPLGGGMAQAVPVSHHHMHGHFVITHYHVSLVRMSQDLPHGKCRFPLLTVCKPVVAGEKNHTEQTVFGVSSEG